MTRSGHYLENYLPRIGLEQFVPVVARIVHFTGYELNVDQIELEEPKDSVVGHLLGTADLGRAARRPLLSGEMPRPAVPRVRARRRRDRRARRKAKCSTARREDLLGKTLSFYQTSARLRLENNFNRVYRYFEAFFERGRSPYIRFIRKNLTFLNTVIQNGDWERLRRHPPCVMPDPRRRSASDRARAAARARLERDARRAQPLAAAG